MFILLFIGNFRYLFGKIDLSSNTVAVETALSFLDLEETRCTPVGVPGVGSEPEFDSTFNTPSDDLDGVATEVAAALVLIDTGLVGHEVLVDLETGFKWSIGVDFVLDGSWGTESLGGSLLDVVVLDWFAIFAGLEGVALGDGTTTRFVWPAGIGDITGVFHEFPGMVEVTTLATVVSGVTGDEVLGGHDKVDGLVGSNAESVRESLSGTESPA